MGDNFKRSFVGYKPKEVEIFLNGQNSEFEKLYREYTKELAQVNEENERLKDELENLKQEMSSYKTSRDKLQNILYSNYIKAATSLYEEEKRLEEMIKEKTSILEAQKNKNSDIKTSINKVMAEIKAIVED